MKPLVPPTSVPSSQRTRPLIPAAWSSPPDTLVWRWSLLLAALALLLQLAVISSVAFPPQHDTPNHMARHFLEARHLFGGDMPPFYEIRYRLLPNLGADLVVPLLMGVLEPILAAKVFLCLSVVLYWVGPALFIWQYGGYRPSSLVPALLLLPLSFSSAFFWGFLNYYSSVGLAFLALFHFGVIGSRKQPRALDLALHALLVALLLLWHLAGFVIYGIVMGAQVAAGVWQGYRAKLPFRQNIVAQLWLALPALPALGFYALYNASKSDAPSYWGPLWHKLLLPLYLFRTYDVSADLVVAALWLGACVALFKRQSLKGQEPWLWMSMAALSAVTLAVPVAWGSTFNADSRLIPALLVCFLCIGSRLQQSRLLLAAGLLAASLAVRYGSVYVEWSKLDLRLQRIAAAFQLLPVGSRIMPLGGQDTGFTLTKDHPETTFVSWAVPLRGAYVPTLFAHRDQQPLDLKLQLPIYASLRGGEIVIDSEPAQAHYDFIWIFNPRKLPVRISPEFTRIFSEEGVTVWRAPPRPERRTP